MNRKCDRCNGVFKIPRHLAKRIIENKIINLYCPYCNCLSSHEVRNEKPHRGKHMIPIKSE